MKSGALSEWQAEQQVEHECERLHGEEVERPWAEVVDEGGVIRGAGGEREVGFQDGVHEKGEALVDDGYAENLEGRFPPGALWPPFQNQGDIERGRHDGEVLDEEVDVGERRRADGDGGGDERLDGGGEPPEVGECEQEGLAREQGESGDESGEIAEVEREYVIQRAWMVAPAPEGEGVCGEVEKDEDGGGDPLAFFRPLRENDQSRRQCKADGEGDVVGCGEGVEGHGSSVCRELSFQAAGDEWTL